MVGNYSLSKVKTLSIIKQFDYLPIVNATNVI